MTRAGPGGIDRQRLQECVEECVEACVECAQACTACVDARLSEDVVAELTTRIRTDLDRADVCAATGRVLSRHTGHDADLTRAVHEACAAACTARGDGGADGCAAHAGMHEHCRVCAESCRRCEQACRALLAGPD